MLKNSFLYAFRRSIPILIGFLPVGLAYGILMEEAGFSFLWSGFTSLVVFAGSLQMLMISFFTGASSLLTIIVTALLLNSRHIFYGLSFLEKFRSYGGWRYFLIYGLPDESYSLLCSYKPIDGVKEKWVHVFSTALIWLYWILFSMLGGLVGSLIPFRTDGIDFALTALFLTVAVEQWLSGKEHFPALAGFFATLGCLLLFGSESFLLPSMALILLLLLLPRRRKGASADA